MMDLRDIREAIALIAEEFDFTTYSFLAENPSPPAVVVSMPDVEYGASLKLSKVTIPVFIVVSRADMESSQALLDASMSTQADSLVDAFNNAKDDAWRSCKVVSAGNVRAVSLGSGECLVSEVVLEVLA